MADPRVTVRCTRCGVLNRVPAARIGEKPVCGKCRSALQPAASGRPVEVTDGNFAQEVVSHPGAVLVDCWAPWCGPCRSLAPVLDQLAREYAGRLKVAKLNTDENPQTAARFGIRSIPTMLLFKNGEKKDTLVGAQPRQEIERRLRSVL